MSKIISVSIIALIACAAPICAHAQQPAEPPEPEPETVRLHVNAAHVLAGTDMAPVADGLLCRSPQASRTFLGPIAADTARLRPAAAFDNLYYVGSKFVGAWLLRTNEGLILFDAMWNERDARNTIDVGMRELDLDPRAIKHVILTHGHVDHYGGARYFQSTYGARIWASAADWELMRTDTVPEQYRVRPPNRDGIIKDGSTLELGGAMIRFVLTPGHTPGTVSAIIPVMDGATKRYVTMWGGTGMPDNAAGVLQMHASLLKLWRAGQEAGAEGAISTHPFVEDSLGRFERKAGNAPSSGNPFNLGRDGYNRIMGIHSECILAQAARYEAWGVRSKR